ncbi:hypothetical protein FOZ61_000684 [Perkinsus olseni]|uniref:Uncharacterized protein n=1 Tax=Perkinsus olseni TaxID=32597 RepID=A0A7J6LZD6_PEROL|nr:hypothetical protein FOZ61_000684 [Perkinsus olseni]
MSRGSSGRRSPSSRRGSGDLWLDQLNIGYSLYRNTEEYLTLCACVQAIQSIPSWTEVLGTDDKNTFIIVLNSIDRLSDVMMLKRVDKSYRRAYNPEVTVAGYLYNTLVTAYSLLPTYLLNGVQYDVSQTVLSECSNIRTVFRSTCEDIVAAYGNLRANTIPMVRSDLANSLTYFDSVWCRFEVHALEEIEVIHKQACGPLREAIEAEIDLSDAEDDSAVRRGRSYHRLVLGRVMDRLSELDDLVSPADAEESRTIFTPECLLEAERILGKKPGDAEKQLCPILMKLSKNLVSTFTGVRRLLRRYGQHMYQLNSHLANNRGLVVTLRRFHEAWVVAARYLSVQSHRKALVEAYGIVKDAQDDIPVEAMLALDPDFLMRLPHLLLYREMEATARSRSASPLKRGKGGMPAASTGLPRMLSDQPMRQSEGSSKSPWQRSKICRLFLEESAADLFNTTALVFTSASSAELHVVYERLVLPSEGRTTGCSDIVEAPSEGLPGPRVEAPPSVVAMESPGKWDGAPVGEDCDTEEFSEKVRSRLSAVQELTAVPHASGDTLAGSNCKMLIHNMAELGLLMQRTRPLEWNRFVQVILQGIVSVSK